MRVCEVFESDTLELPTMNVGDDLLVGKFKNRKAKIKGFTTDPHNQPVLQTDKGDQKLFKPRIVKLMTHESRLPRGFRVFRMPRGTKVFHGTGATFSPSYLESPCWVSTSFEVAQHFMNWHDQEVVDDEDEDDPEHTGKRIIEYQTRRMLRLLYVEGRHTFQEIEDRFGYDMQDPHEMAEVACRLGYDGWYIESNYREGDDTMLCDAATLAFVRMHRVE